MVWDFEGGIVILEQCCDLRFMSQFLKSKGRWVGEDEIGKVVNYIMINEN